MINGIAFVVLQVLEFTIQKNIICNIFVTNIVHLENLQKPNVLYALITKIAPRKRVENEVCGLFGVTFF